MNHARITHRFSFLRGACVVCLIRRWIERNRQWLWVDVHRRRLVRDFEFWTVKASVCAIPELACVVYVSSMLDYARDTRRPSVLMRQNWFETAHVHTRSHLHITHEPRTYNVSRLSRNESACTWNVRETCVFWRAPSVIHVLGVHEMFVEYCAVFARMRRHARYFSDSSVIVNYMCAVHAWFVSDFYSRHPEKLVTFSTHKPNLCVICDWFVRDRDLPFI